MLPLSSQRGPHRPHSGSIKGHMEDGQAHNKREDQKEGEKTLFSLLHLKIADNFK